jgi:uncharacterized membrane protein YqaE (UPF0057 family)
MALHLLINSVSCLLALLPEIIHVIWINVR